MRRLACFLSISLIAGTAAAQERPTVTSADYTRAMHQLGPWTARLNVNNLFDKRYFPDSCCVDRVTPGEPRNWRLSLSRRF